MPNATPTPGARLKALLLAPEILVMPGVYDGFSTRLAEASGFQAALISGAGLSESLFGQPDVGLIGLETNLGAARALAACSAMPLLADADTGYGNAVNVHHAVQDFERAGVAGVMIEDQTWPKRCGHMAGKSVIAAGEMVAKLRAAVDARRDPDFVIKARTDAFATHGLEEVVRRLNLYREAGADLMFADALLSERDIAEVASRVGGPLCVNMGFGIRSRATTPLIPARRLQELGVAAVIYPRLLTACALSGMMRGIAALQESIAAGENVDRPDLAVSFEMLNETMGLEAIRALERRYASD